MLFRVFKKKYICNPEPVLIDRLVAKDEVDAKKKLEKKYPKHHAELVLKNVREGMHA